MPHWRPLATASLATALVFAVAVESSGGHSPFAASAAAQQPVADAVAGATATPDGTSAASADPGASAAPSDGVTPDQTTAPAPRSGASTTTSRSTTSGGSTSAPRRTPAPVSSTPRPTPAPTAAPTSMPTAAPVAQSGTLRVSDGDSGPRLSWTQCTSPSFAAYAVVRSLDSEIHYPAEDKDTVVALLTSPTATSLTDTAAPANTRLWYAVWCLSNEGGEYKTIWQTPTVSYAP